MEFPRTFQQPWLIQPRLPDSPPPGPVDIATWKLLWRLFAIRPRFVEMVALRLGLDGGRTHMFKEVGPRYGVTLSRVGLLIKEVRQAIARTGPPATLPRLVDRLSGSGSVAAAVIGSGVVDERLAAGLVRDGVLAEPLRVDAMVAIAELYGHPVPGPGTRAERGVKVVTEPA